MRANSKLEIERCASLSSSNSAGRVNSVTRAPARARRKAASSISVWVIGSNWSQTWLRQSAKCGRSIFAHRLGRDAEQHVAVERDVGDRARQDAERVERAGGFHHAVHAVLAIGRAVAEHAAERGRADGRAGGLGADRDRHHEVGDRGGRAARRAGRRAGEVVRVAGRAGMQVGELGGDGLAEQHAAGLARQRDAGGVALRLAAFVDRRAPFGRHVEGVDDVLDAERHAGERAAPAALVERAGRGDRRSADRYAPRRAPRASRAAMRSRQARTTASQVVRACRRSLRRFRSRSVR